MQSRSATSDNSPRRLAFVITELEPGGAERCLVELATRLDRSRFSPMVYSLGPPPAEDKRALVARLTKAQIPTHFLGFRSGWDYWSAIRRMAELLREQRAKIVQSFLFHANVVAAQAAKAAGVLHTMTGIRVADPRWWRTSIERIATAHADRFVCVSQSVADFYRRRGFDAEKLVVIPNGVDLARWQNARPANLRELGVPAGKKALLYVGRLDIQKGLDRFFHELPRIFHALPEHDMVIVGNGTLLPTLRRRAGALGIDERVHFTDWRPDVESLMAAAEMLVLPSRWEGMPNVVLEAMAAGKPVVATQAEGTVELLGLAALDQTVPVGDWAALRSRIVGIGQDRQLADDLGRRNRERAQQFSLEFVKERYERLYSSLSG